MIVDLNEAKNLGNKGRHIWSSWNVGRQCIEYPEERATFEVCPETPMEPYCD